MPRKFDSPTRPAEMYGISRRSIHRYITQGLLPAYRIGPRNIRLEVDEVERILLSNRMGGRGVRGAFRMSAIELFNYSDREVRVIVIDGDPWFVLADLCRVLGLNRGPSAVAERLDDGVRQT